METKKSFLLSCLCISLLYPRFEGIRNSGSGWNPVEKPPPDLSLPSPVIWVRHPVVDLLSVGARRTTGVGPKCGRPICSRSGRFLTPTRPPKVGESPTARQRFLRPFLTPSGSTLRLTLPDQTLTGLLLSLLDLCLPFYRL